MMMIPKIILLTGYSGSGKSVVANYLHYRFGYTTINIGDIVEHKFKSTGLNLKNDSRLLKELEKTIERHHYFIILIGAREKYYIDELKKKYNAFIIAIQSNLSLRNERLTQRGLTLAKIEKKNKEEQEIGIDEALKTADIIIENNGTLEELKEKLNCLFFWFEGVD